MRAFPIIARLGRAVSTRPVFAAYPLSVDPTDRRFVAPRPAPRLSPHTTRKATPPEETHAEAAWYLKQMAARTPVVVVLADGEELRGVLEWYDRACLKLNRTGLPNLLLFKHVIKYVYKDPAVGRRS